MRDVVTAEAAPDMASVRDQPVEDGGYIRGAAGLNVSSRSVVRAAAGFWLLLLAVLAVALAVQAIHQTSRDRSLRQSGLPVTVTVTHCLGQAAGTGVTPTGFICTGTFALDGVTHTDVIRGTSDLLPLGSTMRAVTDPHNLSVLSTPHSVATSHAAWINFVSPAIVVLVLLLSGALATRTLRHVAPASSGPTSSGASTWG